MTTYKQTLKHGDTLEVDVAADPVVPPVDPPPVEPPPNALEVRPAQWNQAYLDARKDGETVLLHGGEYNSPFIRVRKAKITLQNFPGEKPILTCVGRPDILYHQIDGVVRGLTFQSQTPGFPDSDTQGAALVEVLGDLVSIGLVWYDGCTFIGSPKGNTKEQLAYLNDRGKPIAEVRFTNDIFDMANGNGFGIHPYDGPSPKLVTSTGDTFKNFDTNAAVLNAANAGIVKVDHGTFIACVTHSRGLYGPVQVSNSTLVGNAIGRVENLGGNTGWTTPR